MASSQASTRSSQSWFSSATFGTTASSLFSSNSAIGLFPSFSDETHDSILALFAGREAKLRLERKRMLAYFKSLPNPAQRNVGVYENDHAWAAAVGGTQTGQKVVDGVIYRYRISPELSLEGSYSSSSYEASGYTNPPSQPSSVDLEDSYTYPSPCAFQICAPFYQSPVLYYDTPEIPEHMRSSSNPESSEWRVNFKHLIDDTCWYQPSPPIPAARDISTIDYKLPGRASRLTVIDEEPEEEQEDSEGSKDSITSSQPSVIPNTPVVSAEEVARKKGILHHPGTVAIAHTIPPLYLPGAHANCFSFAAVPVRGRFCSNARQSLDNEIEHMDDNKYDETAEMEITDTDLDSSCSFSDATKPMNPTIINDHKNVTAYYQVEMAASFSWVSNRKKSASDWNVVTEYVERAQNYGFRDAMRSELHHEYKLASHYFEQLALEDEGLYLVSLRESIKERKESGSRTAYHAMQQAKYRLPWAFCAGYYHRSDPATNDRTVARNESTTTHKVDVGKTRGDAKDMVKAKPCDDKVKIKQKNTTKGRSVSSGTSRNVRVNSKSKSKMAGGHAMVRDGKRRVVDGQGVKAVAPQAQGTSRNPLLFGNDPLPEAPENAIADTDSEDDWDPTCFIEPVKKPQRF